MIKIWVTLNEGQSQYNEHVMHSHYWSNHSVEFDSRRFTDVRDMAGDGQTDRLTDTHNIPNTWPRLRQPFQKKENAASLLEVRISDGAGISVQRALLVQLKATAFSFYRWRINQMAHASSIVSVVTVTKADFKLIGRRGLCWSLTQPLPTMWESYCRCSRVRVYMYMYIYIYIYMYRERQRKAHWLRPLTLPVCSVIGWCGASSV